MAKSETRGDDQAPRERRRRTAQQSAENSIEIAARAAEPIAPPPANDASRHREAPRGARREEKRAEPDPKATREESTERPSRSDESPKRFDHVPAPVLDRYYRIGEKYYLDNGDMAFVNHGQKLTTKSENVQIVRDLLEIAHANEVGAVTVTGTEAFRRTVWAQAQRLGIEVDGFTPTPHDEKQLVRAMAREDAKRRGEDTEARRAPEEPVETARREPAARGRDRANDRAQDGKETGAVLKDRFYYGELLEHGREHFNRDPHEEMSYYVILSTPTGTHELWGKDLERALAESKTRPKIGDQIGVRQTGKEAVTVKELKRDASGNVVGEEPKNTHKNHWMVEKREFFEERAQMARVLRDTSIAPTQGVEQRPQLAGTYATLKLAEEYANSAIADRAARQQFLDMIREATASRIERGESLRTTPVRDRRAPSVSPENGARGAREVDRAYTA